MQALKARVQNGRFVLEDPSTDLPEGSEVEMVVVDDETDPEERAELMATIEENAAAIACGEYVDATELVKDLLARREAASR